MWSGVKPKEPSAPVTYRIQFRPKPEIFSSGTNPLLLLDELRGLGKCSVIAQTSALPPLAEIDPETCYTYWDIILTTEAGENGIRFLLVSGKPLGEPVAWYGPIVMNTQEELRTAWAELRDGTFIKHR